MTRAIVDGAPETDSDLPYFIVGALNDEDIRSLFAYLRSLAPVKSRVPAPLDPVVPGDKQ